MLAFVEKGYQQVTELPFYSSPLSFVGQILGEFGKFTVALNELSNYLKDQHQLSESSIAITAVLSTIVTVIVLTLLFMNIVSRCMNSSSKKTQPKTDETKAKSKKKD